MASVLLQWGHSSCMGCRWGPSYLFKGKLLLKIMWVILSSQNSSFVSEFTHRMKGFLTILVHSPLRNQSSCCNIRRQEMDDKLTDWVLVLALQLRLHDLR